MSAEETQTATNTPATAGPVEVFVAGQEGFTEPTGTKTETPAAKVVETEAKAGSEEQVDGKPREDKGRPKAGVQDRIDELTRARRDAEREVEYWKVRATGGDPTKVAPAEKQPPVRTSFSSEEAYIDAMVDFKADQKVELKLAERETQQKQVQANESRANSWNEKLAAARADIPDFDEVMDGANANTVAGHVAELIMEHDHGAKVAHFYAANPAALEKLNEMSPAKAAFEIGKIAAKFEASSSEPVAKTTVSKAPPPAARSVGSGRSTTTPIGEQSMEDYIATRKLQGAGWAR